MVGIEKRRKGKKKGGKKGNDAMKVAMMEMRRYRKIKEVLTEVRTGNTEARKARRLQRNKGVCRKGGEEDRKEVKEKVGEGRRYGTVGDRKMGAMMERGCQVRNGGGRNGEEEERRKTIWHEG